jgi:hypothetical protein
MTALPRRPAGIAWRRLPLLLPGLLALVAGVAAGLWRLGAWPAAAAACRRWRMPRPGMAR